MPDKNTYYVALHKLRGINGVLLSKYLAAIVLSTAISSTAFAISINFVDGTWGGAQGLGTFSQGGITLDTLGTGGIRILMGWVSLMMKSGTMGLRGYESPSRRR